jgi:malate permease and related proteins
MSHLLYIFINILGPIFIQIIIGYYIQKKMQLSIKTLTKVQIYVLIPALLFIKIYSSDVKGKTVIGLFGFTIALFILLIIASWLVSKALKLQRTKEKAFINSVVLRNQGNFGIPLMALTFVGETAELAMSLHMMVMLATNILLNTYGLYNAGSSRLKGLAGLKAILTLPMLYVIFIGFAMKGLGVPVHGSILSTLEILGDGVVSLALLTLGAQLAETKVNFSDKTLYISNFMRLILSPALAWGMCLVLGIEGLMAQVLILGAAAPTAVNSVLLAIEFDGDASYASESVFTSTVLSALTVSGVIYLVLKFV